MSSLKTRYHLDNATFKIYPLSDNPIYIELRDPTTEFASLNPIIFLI